jgi:hypothetical protein
MTAEWMSSRVEPEGRAKTRGRTETRPVLRSMRLALSAPAKARRDRFRYWTNRRAALCHESRAEWIGAWCAPPARGRRRRRCSRPIRRPTPWSGSGAAERRWRLTQRGSAEVRSAQSGSGRLDHAMMMSRRSLRKSAVIASPRRKAWTRLACEAACALWRSASV